MSFFDDKQIFLLYETRTQTFFDALGIDSFNYSL